MPEGDVKLFRITTLHEQLKRGLKIEAEMHELKFSAAWWLSGTRNGSLDSRIQTSMQIDIR